MIHIYPKAKAFIAALALTLCLAGCSSGEDTQQPNTEAYEYNGIKIEIPEGYESNEAGDATRIAKEGVEGGIVLLSVNYPSEAAKLDLSKVMNVREAAKQVPTGSGIPVDGEPSFSVEDGHPVCSYDHVKGDELYFDVRAFGFDDRVVMVFVGYKDDSDEALKAVGDSYMFTESASAGLTAASEDIASGETPHRDYTGQYDPEIGMSADDVLSSSWGKPEKKNVSESKNSKSEQWVYSNNRYIYLEDGVVTSIQRSE